jgi:hypothetical protein
MSFLLEADERPGSGLERTVREQIKKLGAECEDALGTPAVFAHKARVRTKKIRAALRLARPMMGEKAYRDENRWWRDAARSLSRLRDAGARLEALETLRPFLTQRIGEEGVQRLTERFERQRKTLNTKKVIEAFRALMADGRAAPRIPAAHRKDAVEALKDTYREARRAMRRALEDPDPEALHEWRKRTKYHALQARLLRSMFPGLLPRVGATRDLSDKLGEAQDIEIVLEGMKGWRDAPKGLADALRARRETLVAQAARDGVGLFAEKPKAWAKSVDAPPPPPAQALDLNGAEADVGA